jgi:hypothetical protein
MKLGSWVLVAAFLAGAAAQAQDAVPPDVQAARAAVRQACEADQKSLCGDRQGREAMMCLRGNADKLSAGCKDALAKLPRPPAPAQH